MGYYRAGDFYRGSRGDFYRGYRGDPGLFDFLGGVARSVLPIAAPIIGGALGGPVGAALGGVAGSLLGGAMGATAPGSTSLPIVSSPGLVPFSPIRALLPAAGAAAGTLVTRGISGSLGAMRAAGRKFKTQMMPHPGFGRRRRRVNPLNPRALRRALSRAQRFEHFAKQVVHITSPKKHVSGFKLHRRRRRR